MAREVPVAAVKKAFDLLTILLFEDYRRTGFSLKSLAERVGLPPNSVHNTLKTMARCGYVAKNGHGLYTAGPCCLHIGCNNYVDSDVFKVRLTKVLKRLANSVRESLVFTSLLDGKRSVIARCDPDELYIRLDSRLFGNVHIYSVATGRSMIAFASAEEYQRILDCNGEISELWPEYIEEIPKTRKNGFYYHSVHDGTVCSFAVPFRTSAGSLASLGCYALSFRCSDLRRDEILDELKKAASEFHQVE